MLLRLVQLRPVLLMQAVLAWNMQMQLNAATTDAAVEYVHAILVDVMHLTSHQQVFWLGCPFPAIPGAGMAADHFGQLGMLMTCCVAWCHSRVTCTSTSLYVRPRKCESVVT